MPAKRLPAAGLLPLLLLLACGAARAQGDEPAEEMHGREALRGVEAVRLRVETVPDKGLPGLSAALIERGAAERLRAAGLRVLTGEEAKGAPGAPVLFYRVTMLDTGCGHAGKPSCGYAGTTDMQLREAVRVSRAPGAEVTAATWQHVGRVHFSPPEPERLLAGLVSFMGVFVKEYNAANGR
jgi:hypothetical protein